MFNDTLAIINVPRKAYEYIVNGKSAIGWILDSYEYTIDKKSKIINNPNLYESEHGTLKGLKGGRYVLALLLSVIEMSVKNQEIIETLPEYKLLETESLSS